MQSLFSYELHDYHSDEFNIHSGNIIADVHNILVSILYILT